MYLNYVIMNLPFPSTISGDIMLPALASDGRLFLNDSFLEKILKVWVITVIMKPAF